MNAANPIVHEVASQAQYDALLADTAGRLSIRIVGPCRTIKVTHRAIVRLCSRGAVMACVRAAEVRACVAGGEASAMAPGAVAMADADETDAYASVKASTAWAICNGSKAWAFDPDAKAYATCDGAEALAWAADSQSSANVTGATARACNVGTLASAFVAGSRAVAEVPGAVAWGAVAGAEVSAVDGAIALGVGRVPVGTMPPEVPLVADLARYWDCFGTVMYLQASIACSQDDAGKALEKKYGTAVAAAMIYARAFPTMPTPDFNSMDTKSELDKMRRHVGAEVPVG